MIPSTDDRPARTLPPASSRGPVVAIDGPAGSGKSTVAALVAERLGVEHLDTGAIYRAVTLACLEEDADLDDGPTCAEVAAGVTVEIQDGRTFLDGDDVEAEIRGPEVTAAVSTVSAHAEVRDVLIDLQRDALRRGGVAEGRDIGTVVVPDADVKVFLTASPEERARRRGEQVGSDDLALARQELERRDRLDSTRAHSPLVAAADAWTLDTTGMSVEEVVEAVAERARTAFERRVAEEDPLAIRRRLPRVVVVGRPNVGKSTLVNRVIGHRAAIVEEKPGVTRDRTEHVAQWDDRTFIIVDTGGWEHRAEGLAARVVEQAEAAIAGADLVLFVVDATVGIQEDDERYARLLRRREIPVILAANKVDGPKHEADAYALYELGLGDPYPVSATHGRRVGDLLDAVTAALPEGPVDLPDESEIPRVAIVGKPNVGKSSLFNRLLGEERSIVDEVPHTTRDAVDTVVRLEDRTWVFVDTAGMRRRYRTGEDTELFSVDRTRRAIETSDLVLFVIDASQPVSEQDQRLAALLRDARRGFVVALNKWDLLDDERRADLGRELDRLLHFAAWAPRVNVSALSGRGVQRLLPQLETVWEAYRTRIATRVLNQWLDRATQRTPPPLANNRPLRLKYLTQAETRPPRFVLFTNGKVPPAYRRYLERELRADFGFTGVPITLEDRPPRRRR